MFKRYKAFSRIIPKRYSFATTTSFNPYYILGVDKETPFDEIKKQYFKLGNPLKINLLIDL